MNTDDPWPDLEEAESQVLRMQAKLHQWATDSPDRRFGDLFNLVCRPGLPHGRLGIGCGAIGEHGRPESMG